MRIYLEI